MKCLIANPSPFMRRGLVNHLRIRGCEEIVEAEDGTQALEKCDGSTDLVLTAWNMPGINGIDLVKQLRANTETAAVKVLMITPRNTQDDVLTAREAGIDAYLLKPIQTEILDAHIDRLMEEREKKEAA